MTIFMARGEVDSMEFNHVGRDNRSVGAGFLGGIESSSEGVAHPTDYRGQGVALGENSLCTGLYTRSLTLTQVRF